MSKSAISSFDRGYNKGLNEGYDKGIDVTFTIVLYTLLEMGFTDDEVWKLQMNLEHHFVRVTKKDGQKWYQKIKSDLINNHEMRVTYGNKQEKETVSAEPSRNSEN